MATNDYAFTLRRTKIDVSVSLRDEYEEHLRLFDALGARVKDVEYENKGGLHVHGIIEIPLGMYLKKLRFRGWNLDLKVIYDEQGWLSYIRKENKYKKRLVEVIPIRKKLFKHEYE